NQARPARPATSPSGNTAQRPANAPLPKPLPMTQGGGQSDADSRPDVLARLIDQVDSGSNAARPTARQQSRRFLVQVGAYSNVKSARAAVDRVAKAGFNAYQETVKTSNGDWIRVRVGPFASREDAEQAQQALKRAGVTAALIAL
ncbi:MAG: SPOR domain-containing protein, partial [Lautropia mirabilis]|nr:SPOR domain-containing protein [Lautropia mirabilis]